MTPRIVDQVIHFLHQHPDNDNSVDFIFKEISHLLHPERGRNNLILTLKEMLAEGYIYTAVSNQEITTPKTEYFNLTRKGYQLREDGGFQQMLEDSKERKLKEDSKLDAELQAIRISNRTQKVSRNQGWLNLAVGLIGVVFITITTIQGCDKTIENNIITMSNTLEQMKTEDSLTRVTLQQLIKSQQKVQVDSVKRPAKRG